MSRWNRKAGLGAAFLGASLVLSSCTAQPEQEDSSISDETLDPAFDNTFELSADEYIAESDNIRVEYNSGVLPDETSDPRTPRIEATLGTQLQPDGSSSVYVLIEDNEPSVRLTEGTVTFGNGPAIPLVHATPNDRPEINGEIMFSERQPCVGLTANEELDVNVVAHRDNGTRARFSGVIDTLTIPAGGQKLCAPNREAMGLEP